MNTYLLSKDQYLNTMTLKMKQVSTESIDIKLSSSYLKAIPKEDLNGFKFSEDITKAYVNEIKDVEHLLFPSATKNIFLAIIIDLKKGIVHGHYIVDLNQLYGLS